MQKKHLKLSDIGCYRRALDLSQYIWNVVNKWEWFAKQTIGSQYIRSTDSISSTIAEGFGRYFKKDKILFYRYSLGSVSEALDWTQKSWKRSLLTKEQYKYILKKLQELPKEIYNLINFTNDKLKKIITISQFNSSTIIISP